MQEFGDILFADLTTSPNMPRAVHEAGRIAETNHARLLLYGVVPEPPELQRSVRPEGIDRPVSELVRDAQKARLAEIALNIRSREGSVEIEVAVDVGSAPLEIVRRVLDQGHDLVVLSTDGSDGSWATVRRVLRLCPCPVWVLRPSFTGRRVLAAINPEDELELNQRILQLSHSHLSGADAELHVVHAWEPYGLDTLIDPSRPAVSRDAIQRYVAATESAHRAAFELTIAEADEGPPPRLHLIDGPPQGAISALVQLYRIDLLVMGAVGHAMSDRTLIGNTAEGLFNETASSVLVVKPTSFTSPVAALPRNSP